MVVVGLGAIGVGFWLVSIMGSGPCEPPPCTSGTGFCQETCNGPENLCCKESGDDFECGSCAPCDSNACPDAPPCYTAVCIEASICGATEAGARCCRYDYVVDEKCPLENEDLSKEDEWSGTCKADLTCGS